jgi:hypothetical protein
MEKVVVVENNFNEGNVTLTYSDGSKVVYEVDDEGKVSTDIFRRLEVSMFNGMKVIVKRFV